MKMRNILLVVLLLSIGCVNAQELKVDINKDTLYLDDEVIATVSVENNNTMLVTWDISCGFVSEDHSMPPLLFLKQVSLNPFETKTLNFSMSIGETMPSGSWKVIVDVLDDSEIIETKFSFFEVKGTKKVIDAYLSSCGDEGCEDVKSVFILGDKVYIKLFTDIPLDLSAELKTPKITKQLTFTNNIALIKPEVVGIYTVMVTLSKEGYQTATRTLQFAVIKEAPKIKNMSICNADGICSGKENYQNCPQDCPKPSVTSSTTTLPPEKPEGFEYIPHIAILFVIIILGILIYRKIKRD